MRRGAVVDEGALLEGVLDVDFSVIWPLGIVHIPLWRASSPSMTLLLLVAGTSTGAVVVPLGALVELGVSSRCAGGFFFLRRLHRPRKPFLTWAKASSAMSKEHCLVYD